MSDKVLMWGLQLLLNAAIPALFRLLTDRTLWDATVKGMLVLADVRMPGHMKQQALKSWLTTTRGELSQAAALFVNLAIPALAAGAEVYGQEWLKGQAPGLDWTQIHADAALQELLQPPAPPSLPPSATAGGASP